MSGSVRLTAMSLPNGTVEWLQTYHGINSNGVNVLFYCALGALIASQSGVLVFLFAFSFEL